MATKKQPGAVSKRVRAIRDHFDGAYHKEGEEFDAVVPEGGTLSKHVEEIKEPVSKDSDDDE